MQKYPLENHLHRDDTKAVRIEERQREGERERDRLIKVNSNIEGPSKPFTQHTPPEHVFQSERAFPETGFQLEIKKTPHS